jgi:hypothetical protein
MYILPLYNFQHFQFEHGVFFELKPIRAAGQQQTDWTQSWFPSSPRKTVTGSPPPPPPPPHGRFHHQQVAPLHSTPPLHGFAPARRSTQNLPHTRTTLDSMAVGFLIPSLSAAAAPVPFRWDLPPLSAFNMIQGGAPPVVGIIVVCSVLVKLRRVILLHDLDSIPDEAGSTQWDREGNHVSVSVSSANSVWTLFYGV